LKKDIKTIDLLFSGVEIKNNRNCKENKYYIVGTVFAVVNGDSNDCTIIEWT
jgi:hypothetical protein